MMKLATEMHRAMQRRLQGVAELRSNHASLIRGLGEIKKSFGTISEAESPVALSVPMAPSRLEASEPATPTIEALEAQIREQHALLLEQQRALRSEHEQRQAAMYARLAREMGM